MVGFPQNAVPGQVDAEVIDRLMLVFTILTALFISGAVLTFLRFPLGEDDHRERVRQLAESEAARARSG
jgi:GPH family glycoside/pentoside/hexuronide:cation symporter